MPRLKKDIQDLITYDFSCTSSSLVVTQEQNESSGRGGFVLNVCIHEGPYHGGHFIFYLDIPDTYPFVPVNVWAINRPIWHPNIDVQTGRVSLPMEWTPVLTLTVVALAIQLMLLEPQLEHPVNVDACSFYSSVSLEVYEGHIQRIFQGCVLGSIEFPCMSKINCQYCKPWEGEMEECHRYEKRSTALQANRLLVAAGLPGIGEWPCPTSPVASIKRRSTSCIKELPSGSSKASSGRATRPLGYSHIDNIPSVSEKCQSREMVGLEAMSTHLLAPLGLQSPRPRRREREPNYHPEIGVCLTGQQADGLSDAACTKFSLGDFDLREAKRLCLGVGGVDAEVEAESCGVKYGEDDMVCGEVEGGEGGYGEGSKGVKATRWGLAGRNKRSRVELAEG